MPTDASDNIQDLLQRVARGDQAAYEQLFTRYWDLVYSTAYMFTKSAELSEDLAQDIFARIWEKRAALSEVDAFDNYLFITARNLIVDRLRKDVRDRASAARLTDFFTDHADASTPVGAVEMKELERLVWEGVDRLPEQQRTAFRLSRYQGLDHAAISARMGVSKQSVKSYIVRAIASLRRYVSLHGR